MKNTDSKRNKDFILWLPYRQKSLERLEFYKVVPDVGLSIDSEQLSVFKRLHLENEAQQAIFYSAKGNRSFSSYCMC